MQKVLITGASGLLGSELVKFAKSQNNKFEVISLSHNDFELTDFESILAVLNKYSPDIIINTAVVVSVDKCHADIDHCYAVNRDGVKNILKALVQIGKQTTFIQISSSEVFGRVKEGEFKIDGYTESDIPRPVSEYQKSKAEAEVFVQDYASKNPEVFTHWFIARAGWLYGRGRKTFVEFFLEDLQKKNELVIIKDQWRSPTWTKHFAEGLFELIEGDYKSGIYHITNEVKTGEATTPQVIQFLQDYLGDRAVASIKEISREGFFKVPRAPSNVLLNTKLPKLPPWQKALSQYLQTTKFK